MRHRDIEIDSEELAKFCRARGIARLSLFGSILRDDFGPESDVDVLVEFWPGARVSLFDMVEMELALSSMVGRKVDLRTPQGLSKYFRDRVLAEAEVQYAA